MDIIITCKDRLVHLKKCIATIKDKSKIFVVCYGDEMAFRYCQQNRIRSCLTAAKDFHLSKARNLGVAETNEEWIFFCDADTLLDSNFFNKLDLKEGNYYTGEPDCSGNCIVKRSDFMGYDENIKGYGGEDTDLYISLTRKGVAKNFIKSMRYIPHSDFDRTKNYGNNKKWEQQKKNIIYLMSKHPHECIFPQYVPNEMKTLFV